MFARVRRSNAHVRLQRIGIQRAIRRPIRSRDGEKALTLNQQTSFIINLCKCERMRVTVAGDSTIKVCFIMLYAPQLPQFTAHVYVFGDFVLAPARETHYSI
mmetsp:Transcript_2457/g.6647  ORF Transcript_2457/g.6647 Transcript_2457/m.6647 type:complete len:102 (-) Transcript_2457:215-520(-)